MNFYYKREWDRKLYNKVKQPREKNEHKIFINVDRIHKLDVGFTFQNYLE